MVEGIEHSREWIVVGSSPSAGDFFDHALARFSSAATITANAGIYLFETHACERPDYYVAIDAHACSLFSRHWRKAQTRGAKIVTLRRSTAGLVIRGMTNADVFIDLPDRGDAATPFVPGEFHHPRFSGLICTQIALNSGAERIVWLGMEGYASSGAELVTDTFDGRIGKAAGAKHTRDWIAPFMQSCIDACPNVEFVFCGKPRYELSGENLTMAPAVEDIRQ